MLVQILISVAIATPHQSVGPMFVSISFMPQEGPRLNWTPYSSNSTISVESPAVSFS
jgi:hypothetical protein